MHFVGEWHTHPEPHPAPSSLDLSSAREAFVTSIHELNFFVSIIVGNEPEKLDLWVGVHDGVNARRLVELKPNTATPGQATAL
jgi:proteasome lid subunit RPN8/RPN11